MRKTHNTQAITLKVMEDPTTWQVYSSVGENTANDLVNAVVLK